MDLTPLIPCNALPSAPCDLYIATVFLPSRIIIRSTTSLSIKRVINIDPTFAAAVTRLQWTNPMYNGHRRLLVADGLCVRAYDMDDEQWELCINEGLGGVRNAEWSNDGEHILVWSDFQLKLTAWSVNKSLGSIIANPKFVNKGCCTKSGNVRQFAILQRTAHDLITLVDSSLDGWKIVKTFPVDCSDAQGLARSSDGKWLAVWDSCTEYKVLIYTADGRLIRTFTAYTTGLGIKTVEWSPDSEYLAIGSYDGKVRLLNNLTFSPVIELTHPSTIRAETTTVWRQVTHNDISRYDVADQPISPPFVKSSPGELSPKFGIGLLLFSPDGSFVATKSDSMPTTLWIWSLREMLPIAILVHNHPIRTVQWHPHEIGQLVFTCHGTNISENNALYLWNVEWPEPRIVAIPRDGFEVKWFSVISNEQERETGILIGNSQSFTIGYPIHSQADQISVIEEESEETGRTEDVDASQTSMAEDELQRSLIIHDAQLPISVM